MNSHLDVMAFHLARFIKDRGYGALPIPSSNIWRYNEYAELKAIFAPDVSHIYMAVVVGLAEVGYSGLAITPEFGARNRFITVLTNAELTPDPLVEPGSVCDRCMLCRQHCPSGALSKELDGDNVLKIDGREYRFPRKNLWRCAWGEHFNLDLDLEIPETVTEEVILQTLREHGSRSGEMGACLKHCLPRNRRAQRPDYSKTVVRKTAVTYDEALDERGVADQILSEAVADGVDGLLTFTADNLRCHDIDIGAELTDARAAAALAPRRPGSDTAGRRSHRGKHGMGCRIERVAREFGADLVGVASADRMNGFADQLAPVFDGQRTLSACNKAIPYVEWDPELAPETRRVMRPEHYLPAAKSVVVLGLRLHEAPLVNTGNTPARAVGPYVYQTYASDWVGGMLALRLARHLEHSSYRAVVARDLLNTGGFVATPRGAQYDLTGNRFAAIAAGLGGLLHNGHVATEEFGEGQRFFAIVTDAPITPSDPVSAAWVASLCDDCSRPCVASCPTAAIAEQETLGIHIAGVVHRMARIDRWCCDWSRRYALTRDCGFNYIGSETDECAPDRPDAERLAESLAKLDPIKKQRPTVAEPCVLACPHLCGRVRGSTGAPSAPAPQPSATAQRTMAATES